MSVQKLSRRAFLERAMVLGAASVAGGALLAACNKGGGELDCNEGVTPEQTTQREALGYVEASTESGKNCANCNFYSAAGEGECGGCTLLPDQGVNPEGYCNSWAEKA